MAVPLEDTFVDILGKAQRGLGLSDTDLAKEAGVSVEQVRALRGGKLDAEIVSRAAPVLRLHAGELTRLAEGTWTAPTVEPISGLAAFNTPFDDMTVNAYLVWDPESHRGVAFDTGTDCSDMLAILKSESISLDSILLTHTHGDHIAALDELRQQTRAPVYVSSGEPLEDAQPIQAGKRFEVGKLQIETRSTWGHSRGGLTFFVTGLQRPLAIVGDSLFAGSMGGGMVSYEAAVRNNIEQILSLPGDTVVCPGHGPVTTVNHEKRHNPFFAGA